MQQHTNIKVTKKSGFPQATFEVKVGSGEETASFDVTVSEDYWQSLTDGDITPKVLVEKSFVFLLSRESRGDILSSFKLEEIEGYFPNYPSIVTQL